jgi:hypothetical protein
VLGLPSKQSSADYSALERVPLDTIGYEPESSLCWQLPMPGFADVRTAIDGQETPRGAYEMRLAPSLEADHQLLRGLELPAEVENAFHVLIAFVTDVFGSIATDVVDFFRADFERALGSIARDREALSMTLCVIHSLRALVVRRNRDRTVGIDVDANSARIFD